MEKRGDFMENFILEDHAPSLLPSGKKWKLVEKVLQMGQIYGKIDQAAFLI